MFHRTEITAETAANLQGKLEVDNSVKAIEFANDEHTRAKIKATTKRYNDQCGRLPEMRYTRA